MPFSACRHRRWSSTWRSRSRKWLHREQAVEGSEVPLGSNAITVTAVGWA